MHTPLTPSYKADLAAVAYVAEMPPEDIVGWSLMVWGPDGQVSLSHNACCTAHAHGQLTWLLNNMPAALVECSGEQ